MKKFLSIMLCFLMIFGMLALTACSDDKDTGADTTDPNGTDEVTDADNSAEALKFGLGIYSAIEASDADGDINGEGEAVVNVAAVLVDADGKIVSCEIDVADSTVAWTSAGAGVEAGEFQTKLELGDNYGMAAYGTDLNGDGEVKEWYAQADAFCKAAEGKTIDEVKALVAEDGYHAVDDIQTAGCTIGVADYVHAIEKAVANAIESTAVSGNTVQIGVVTSAECDDATEEADGKYEVVSTVVAAAVDADGKVTASASDAVQIDFTFDLAGVSTTDAEAEVLTKVEKGTNYGMAAYGTDLNGDGVVKEWNEQAAAFDAACVGKNASEIGGLVGEDSYHGTDDLQTAGCTMGVSDLVKAAVKAATVA